jgi:hypothetical protein
MTAFDESETGRPPDWDRSVPASLSWGLARSDCQLSSCQMQRARAYDHQRGETMGYSLLQSVGGLASFLVLPVLLAYSM